jgi:hypothetical protein
MKTIFITILSLFLFACGASFEPIPTSDASPETDAAPEASPGLDCSSCEQGDCKACPAACYAFDAGGQCGTRCVGDAGSVALGDPACFEFTDPDGGLEVCQPCPIGTACKSLAFGWQGVCD